MATWGGDSRYEQLVESHGERLFRVAYLLLGNRQDAEDAVQDALITVASKWSVIHRAAGLSYLVRAVSNRALDIRKRSRPYLPGELPEQSIDDLGLLRHESDQAFFALLTSLPERQRWVLILRFHADLSDADVGRLLEISPNTVRSQASRALASLRVAMSTLETERLV